MENNKEKFEIGDWVLLTNETLDKLSDLSTQNAKKYIQNYKYPKKVLSIIETPLMNGSTGYLYVMGKGLKIRGREFRLATEKEIKEQEIRSKFVQ